VRYTAILFGFGLLIFSSFSKTLASGNVCDLLKQEALSAFSGAAIDGQYLRLSDQEGDLERTVANQKRLKRETHVSECGVEFRDANTSELIDIEDITRKLINKIDQLELEINAQ